MRMIEERNLWYGEFRTRWYIVLWSQYRETRIYLHREDDSINMYKCLKKAWKYYQNKVAKWNKDYPYDVITVDAVIESEEDGDLSYMGQYWAMEEYYYMEEHDMPLPGEIPFI